MHVLSVSRVRRYNSKDQGSLLWPYTAWLDESMNKSLGKDYNDLWCADGTGYVVPTLVWCSRLLWSLYVSFWLRGMI